MGTGRGARTTRASPAGARVGAGAGVQVGVEVAVQDVLQDLRRRGVVAVVDGRGTGRTSLLDAVAAASARGSLRVVGRGALADVPLGALAASVAAHGATGPAAGDGLVAAPRSGAVEDADEVARLVRGLVADGGGLLVVDDAHLLHPRDLAVLAATLRIGLRVLLSASDEAPWPEGLDALLADAPLHRLARLDLAGALALCDRVAGGTPDRARAVRLLHLSGGRPGHLLRLLGRDHDVLDDLLVLPRDPATTDAAVAWYRLRTGSDDARRLARLVVRVPAPTVEQLADLVGGAVLDVGVAAGLVSVVGDAVELRDPLVAAVAAGHDRRVHGAADARLLLEVVGAPMPTALRDRWRAEAGLPLPPGDLARVVVWTVDRGDPERAVWLAGRGRDAEWSPDQRTDGADVTGGGQGGAELALARAVALTGAGRHEEAIAACEELLAEATGDLAGRVCLLLADLRFFRAGDAAGALRALAAVGPDDPLRPDAEAMQQLVRNATDPGAARRRPPAVGELPATPRMLADLLALLAGRVSGPGSVVVPAVDAGPPGVPVHERSLANQRAAALYGSGCAAARPLVDHELERVVLAGRPGAVALALQGVAELELVEGRLVRAERTVREALSWAEVDDEAGLRDPLVGMRSGLLAELGRLEQARALLDELAPRVGGDLRALLFAAPGQVRCLAAVDRAAAVAAARGAVDAGLATGHVVWAARAAVEAARVGLADDVADLVADLADDPALGALPRADAAAVLALADGGSAALAAAADACAAVGRRRVAADLLLARLPVPEVRRRRAAALLDGLGPPHPDRAGRVEPLTAREEQVARLAAAGLTSRAVAERLGVSVRTVDNHLRRAYRKLGIGGRGELAGVLGAAGPA